MTLLNQYRSGDCEKVWRQIVDERRTSSDTEAVAVAEETVLRAQANLHSIFKRLVELGYEFAEPDDAFVTTSPEESAEEIASLEVQFGALPGLVKIWYSHIHSVNFAQAPSQCSDPHHVLRNLGWFPLAIYLPLKKCRALAEKNLGEYREWYRKMQSRNLEDFDVNEHLSHCKTPEEMARFLPLGSSASNNENKGFALPCDFMDTAFYDDGEVTHFNEDLRYVIMSGGFRMLSPSYRSQMPRFMKLGHPDPVELQSLLTNDLQPL